MSDHTLVDTIEHKGWKIEIHVDEDAQNPAQEWDMLTFFAVWHRNYDLNSTGIETSGRASGKAKWRWPEPSDFQEWAKDPENGVVCILPLFMYEHSGITISTSNGTYPFNDRWDSGQCGFVFCTKESVAETMGFKRITKKQRAKLIEAMQQDVKTVDDYCTGSVYGYMVKPPDEHEEALASEHDSCWGFYGYDEIKQPNGYMIKEAMGTLNYLRKHLADKIRAERREARHYAQLC